MSAGAFVAPVFMVVSFSYRPRLVLVRGRSYAICGDFIAYVDESGMIRAKCTTTKREIKLIEEEGGTKLRIIKIDLGIAGADYYSEINIVDNNKEVIVRSIEWLTKR